MKKVTFSDVLDAAESLPIDEKEELVELLHKRTIEERRRELTKDVKKARSDFRHGRTKSVSADALMKEIVS
ncbi:MAG: hypothetical protein JW795_19295 [Chitinivibrionales bacterium]|nr:hypothetical protein [Chitinivibrionales bacterium]